MLLAGLKWYGYTHLVLRRLGTPLNAFTLLRWTMELTMFAALVYVVRVARSEARTKSSFEPIAGAES